MVVGDALPSEQPTGAAFGNSEVLTDPVLFLVSRVLLDIQAQGSRADTSIPRLRACSGIF